jgi:signal peptidase II
MAMERGPATVWLWLSAVVVVLDQATKALAELYLDRFEAVEVLSFFNLVLTYNSGAAFSFLRDAGGWQRIFFVVVTVAVLVFLLRWLWGLKERGGILPLAIASIIGGAIGNLIDRVATGLVVDFLDFHYAGWHWPAFNVADSAIFVGVALLLYDALFLAGGRDSPAPD